MDELAVHELAETEFRKLAPEARSLDAAEGQMRRRPGGLIDEDHAAFDPFGERLAMRDIVGKDGGAEPVGRIVRKRSEEHTSELQSLMRISYAVFCLKKKKNTNRQRQQDTRSIRN